MASYSFPPHINVKELSSKNSFDPILNFGFNLERLKMYTYYIKWSQFCKGLLK